MKYKWGTLEVYNYNHLYDENLRWLCSSYNQDSIFLYEPIEYYPNKKHCPLCSKKNLQFKVTKTYGPNVLHINRKIFI